MFHPDSVVDHDTMVTAGSSQSHPTLDCPSASATTCQAVCFDTEMLACHNAEVQDGSKVLIESSSARCTASDLNRPVSEIVSDASPLSLPYHVGSASTSPSEISSNWRQSPTVGSTYIWPDSPLPRYPGSLKRLESLYGLSMEALSDIIQLSDYSFREDVVSFIESFCHSLDQHGLWYFPAPGNPVAEGPILKNLLKGFCCAEILTRSSIIDPVRLRLSRVLLYHYFERLRIDLKTDSSTLGQRSRGKGTATFAKNKVLDGLHSAHDERLRPQTRKEQWASLDRHKKIGKRWSIMATYLGLGVFLTCSPSLAAKM